MSNTNKNFNITHIIGFTYGVIASSALSKFISSVTQEISQPIITRGVNKTLGKKKTIKFCKTEIHLNDVIINFVQLVLVLSIIALMIKVGIKPQGRLIV